MKDDDCIFCNIPQQDIIAENELALAFYDRFPVNKGHSLIISKRHAETYFDASPQEHAAISALIVELKSMLDEQFKPDGYNIGINVGAAGGQTIFHLHYHLLPRYLGDVEDPRGGVRKIKKAEVPYAGEGE